METKQQIDNTTRSAQLHAVGRNYVMEGLGQKNFDAIPYTAEVALRAPLCPGGSGVPLVGRENLRTVWWPPLPQLIGEVTVIDTYVNQDLTAVTVEFHLGIIAPACTLRVIDRFTVDGAGQITTQENFFDPRDVTNPGWRDGGD